MIIRRMVALKRAPCKACKGPKTAKGGTRIRQKYRLGIR